MMLMIVPLDRSRSDHRWSYLHLWPDELEPVAMVVRCRTVVMAEMARWWRSFPSALN